ncbi:methyltransferase domain-containing protein [Undibacterium seohonense]|uniref:Methyltransferase domain-containing protein n=1 Tax=Undibacterium seohonense TaxID=1344950 RepID=A0ABR6WZY2_9BURK|nr:class I SAM-dependent methyltransferase [Undibacterium seohonense]MBC3806253.1 methyltransferase domain-containing protein [Undibacterium seohonense]
MELNAMDNQHVSGQGARQESAPHKLRSFGGRRHLVTEQLPIEENFGSLPDPVIPALRRPASETIRFETTPFPTSESQVPQLPQTPSPACEHFPILANEEVHEPGVKAYILRKFNSFTRPGISIKERIRSLPLIGYAMAWGNALSKLAVTRHHHQLALENLREQNQILREDILMMHQKLNALERADQQFELSQKHLQTELQRVATSFELTYCELRELHASIAEMFVAIYQGPNSLLGSIHASLVDGIARFEATNEKINRLRNDIDKVNVRTKTIEDSQADARLRQLENMDGGNRLMKLEQLEIARKLNQLSHLIRKQQRDQNVAVHANVNEQNLQQQVSQIEQRLKSLVLTASSSDEHKYETGKDIAHLDQFYIEFEDKFRGSKQEIKQRLRAYLPYVDAFARASDDQGRCFVDVGCGRGEWLELLGELGIPALGIDMNAAMVDACIASGCAAKVDDAIAYLQRQPAGSLAGVTGFHIVEHLPFETLIALFDAAYAALGDGGILIFETPNPENMIVGSCNFYYDPTHRNPIVPAVAEFIATQRGFTKAEILRLHPFPESYRVKDEGFSGDIINQFFYGPQDYALIAWK